MIKTIFWNARGACNARFNAVVFDLVKSNNVDILAICEPKVQFSKASDTLLKLGFIVSMSSRLLKLVVSLVAYGFSGIILSSLLIWLMLLFRLSP